MRAIDCGDTVVISTVAPARFRPGATGSVISMFESPSEKYREKTGVPVGEVAI